MTPDRAAAIRIIREAAREGRFRREPARRLIACLRSDERADWHSELVAKALSGQLVELEDAFYRLIPFGTAGQRGPVGAGINRINDHIIELSVQGVCSYVRGCRDDAALAALKREPRLRAVVAYDTRMDSAWLAQLVTSVLLGNRFEVHLFRQPVATPELSHAVLQRRAAVGFMVSASHNPPGDNGIKVYWNYGGQVLPLRADAITRVTEQAATAKGMDFDAGVREGLVVPIAGELDAPYLASVRAQGMTPVSARPPRRRARLVFSPLHGTGARTVIPVLEDAGWKVGRDLFIVESQVRPDPKFRGCPGGIPNPEFQGTLQAGAGLAERSDVQADLVLATDPDADRLAIHVVDPRPGPAPNFLLGGQLAAVLGEWTLSQLKARRQPVAGGTVVKSVVTSHLVDDVLCSHDVRQVLVGVGFKYVGEVSLSLEQTPERFLFGCEQSYGFVRGMHCRDKDGAVAALLAAELCDHLKRRGRTIRDYLVDLWQRHGYHAERATPVRMSGIEGLERIVEIMRELRVAFPRRLGGLEVRAVEDALKDEVFDPAGRNRRSARRWDDQRDSARELYDDVGELGWGWRGENILRARFRRNDASWVIIRPSGTEPSLKIYVNIHEPLRGRPLAQVAESAETLALGVERDVKRTIGLG
ncbi:MAG: phospho-sugar mutase [Armatimonadetes bacterium]|nr:phospho-sugar mutase [Armatimonadota bacterium]